MDRQALLLLGMVLFFGLFIPQYFARFHFPFTSSLIIVGAIMGPNGLAYVPENDTLQLFGFVGAAFQMLLAGSEARLLDLDIRKRAQGWLLLMNGLVPASMGIALMRALGYPWLSTLFVGAVFLSSSVMLVFSFVHNLGLDTTEVGRSLKSLVVQQDLLSTLCVFVIFQSLESGSRFPLLILSGLLISSVMILRMFLPEVVTYFFDRFGGADEFEERLRLVLAVLLIVVFLYTALGVHPIIAAFLVGFCLAEVPGVQPVREKLQTIGYAAFIPVFLFVIGMETDFRLFAQLRESTILLALLVVALASKVLGGFWGAWLAGFKSRPAMVIGVGSSTKLTVALSAAFTAMEKSVIDVEVFTAIILVSVVSALITPLVLNVVARGEVSA